LHILQEYQKTYKAVPRRSESELFGSAIAISGNYAIIGAKHDALDTSGENPLNNAGSAYLFERDYQANWTQVAKIIASERAINDFFGTVVAICGNYAVVGAPQEDADSAGFNLLPEAGSVYIYERDGYGTWRFKQRLVAEDRESDAYFGQSVSITKITCSWGAS
jgi:hypothetical protein